MAKLAAIHLYTRTHIARQKVVGNMCPVAVNTFLVSATKLLSVCCPSVAGYKGIQVDRDKNE